MKILFTLCVLFCTTTAISQNPYIGKWVVNDIREFKDRVIFSDAEKKAYDSHITFKSDMTYEKLTDGVKTLGIYEFESNKLRFYEKNSFGEFQKTWSLRWPKKGKDPMPNTPEIDICFPELFTVKGTVYELNVYYVKSN